MSNLQDKQPMCTYTLGEEREFGHLLFGSINVGYDILCPQKGTLVGFSQSVFHILLKDLLCWAKILFLSDRSCKCIIFNSAIEPSHRGYM